MIVDNKANGKFVGYFLIDGSQKFGFTKKPNILRRMFYFLFLGWKWHSNIPKQKPKWVLSIMKFFNEVSNTFTKISEKVKNVFNKKNEKVLLNEEDNIIEEEKELVE